MAQHRSSWDPYTSGARFYDLFSGEVFYRTGRVAGIAMLGLQPGEVVLDVGCGTGLNFERLKTAVSPTGRVIGLDRSEHMLRVAHDRIDRNRWTNVSLVRADATCFTADQLPADHINAVLATYALSVTGDPDAAWRRIKSVAKPGARVCVVDMQKPTGWAQVFTPLARLACSMGRSDIEAKPWQLLQRDARQVQVRSLRGGHIQAACGTMP